MGSTVYLLPGLMCDETVWRAQALALSDRYDVRTPGRFDHDSLQGMARSVLDGAPERFAVAGHSMGGRVALEVMALAPERVEGIALLDTGAHPLAPGEAGGRRALVDLAFSEGMGAVVDAWLPPMMGARGLANAPLMRSLRAMLMQATPELLRKQQTALLNRPDGFTRLPLIKVPCALIVGRQDAWSPPAQHEDIQRQVPGAVLTVIDDSGHMAPVEQPEAVTAALERWLAALA